MPTPSLPTHLCLACNTPREAEIAHCAGCDEVTASYLWTEADEDEARFVERMRAGWMRPVEGFAFTELREGFVCDREAA